MAEITASAVKSLREKSGAGMIDCKNALVEANGDETAAMEILRKKGMATGRQESRPRDRRRCGRFVHPHGRQGRRARRDQLRKRFRLTRRRISAARQGRCDAHRRNRSALRNTREKFPRAISTKNARSCLNSSRTIRKTRTNRTMFSTKIIDGRLNKFYEDNVLVDQPFVKDPSKTIGELVAEKIGSIKENISIRRFARFKMGEGIEKKARRFRGRSRVDGWLVRLSSRSYRVQVLDSANLTNSRNLWQLRLSNAYC